MLVYISTIFKVIKLSSDDTFSFETHFPTTKYKRNVVFNKQNCDQKSQLSGMTTEQLIKSAHLHLCVRVYLC